MRILRETTETFPARLRHTYLVSDDKSSLLGYIPLGEKKPIMFKVPKTFWWRDRTFITVC